MTTTQTAPTTDSLVVIPAVEPAGTPEAVTTASHTKAIVAGGILMALVVAAVAGGLAYLANDDAPPAAAPTQVGTIEDDSAVVHGGAGQLMTVDGLPVVTVGAAGSTTIHVGTIEDDSAVVHGGAGQLMTVDGLPVVTVATAPSSSSVETGSADPSIAHGSGDGVVTSSGPVH